jgi:hypothetical protein
MPRILNRIVHNFRVISNIEFNGQGSQKIGWPWLGNRLFLLHLRENAAKDPRAKGNEAMDSEGLYVFLGLKVWKAQIERADKLFGSLSSEEILREIAPGKNRLVYLWGHLTAVHDAMLPLLGLGERLHPQFDAAFVSHPDKSRADIPSHEQVRQAWNTVNGELRKGFEKMSWSDWLQRHSAVSAEDFAKDASRNRFAILLSRTNHLSYHLGQAVLGLKGTV